MENCVCVCPCAEGVEDLPPLTLCAHFLALNPRVNAVGITHKKI